MSRTKRAAKKTIVGLIGFPLLLLGIILIPLPGPGLLVCFLALLLLSREFDWAAKHAENAKTQVRKINDKAKARAEKIKKNP